MPERIPAPGERVGFVDDSYSDRTAVVVRSSEFFQQVMLRVRPEGDWPADEMGTDGTIILMLEECFEFPKPDDVMGDQ